MYHCSVIDIQISFRDVKTGAELFVVTSRHFYVNRTFLLQGNSVFGQAFQGNHSILRTMR